MKGLNFKQPKFKVPNSKGNVESGMRPFTPDIYSSNAYKMRPYTQLFPLASAMKTLGGSSNPFQGMESGIRGVMKSGNRQPGL